MSTRETVGIIVLAAVLSGMIVPALAQSDPADPRQMPSHGMSMGNMHGRMMPCGMMSGGMMGRGCSEMMQSMNNGDDGRPNSQWQKRSPAQTPAD
jgi:hypothetical protein